MRPSLRGGPCLLAASRSVPDPFGGSRPTGPWTEGSSVLAAGRHDDLTPATSRRVRPFARVAEALLVDGAPLLGGVVELQPLLLGRVPLDVGVAGGVPLRVGA